MSKRLPLAAVIVVAVLCACAAAPSPADARPFLSKKRAWLESLDAARYMYLRLDDITDWAVEPHSGCRRIRAWVVDCEYELYDEINGITCWGDIRVRARASGRTSWVPRNEDCGFS